jgi:gliding motility-associated-like protein
MRKISSFLLFSGFTSALVAQTALFNNNGADIYVKDGAFMIVKTNSIYNNIVNGAGVFDNAGTVVVEGFVKNDGVINGNGDTIRLTGDWVNNNSYTGNNSWVEMNGGTQQITGTSVTTFNNLSLLGGTSLKRQTIDAVTSGTLALNDAELATDVNEMLVSNNNPNAITRNTGFVSSVGSGRLSRNTLASSAYLFPTGSPSYANPPSIFRPIEFTPATASPNTYGAALVKGDATADGYDVSVTDDVLCLVNRNFYHRLYQTSGADASALRMFFDAATDGDWLDQAHWDTPNRWNDLGPATVGSGLGFSSVSVNNVSDFQPEPFALARKKFTVDAGPDVSLVLGQSTTFNPAISSVNVSTVGWTPDFALSCDNCEKPTASPTLTTRYTILVTDDAGCAVSDSLLVTVTAPELLIPTAFSPNGDGVNDKFRVMNKNVVKFNLQIYNRWGEKVFETSDFTSGWDGVFRGVEQEMGVYVWTCEYMLQGQTKSTLAKGNVTLMR